jgi:hypothetical protein
MPTGVVLSMMMAPFRREHEQDAEQEKRDGQCLSFTPSQHRIFFADRLDADFFGIVYGNTVRPFKKTLDSAHHFPFFIWVPPGNPQYLSGFA